MSSGFAKVALKTAVEVAKQYEVGEAARDLIRDGLTPKQFLDLLVERQLYVEAVRFLAFALPKREAVWWAYQCARQASGATPPPRPAAALAAAEKWVSNPTDTNRWAAKAAGEAAGNEHPAGLAALAAFWTSGSITPAGQHPVPTPEHLTGLMAGAAVMLATVFVDAHLAMQKYQQFLALGFDIAHGKNVWK